MKRGTTCKHTFRTNVDLTNATVFVTYQQGKSTILEKTNDELEIQARKLIVNLTQEDTLSFAANSTVTIQVRYVMADGTADASNKVTINVQDIIKDGEIAYVAPTPTPEPDPDPTTDDTTTTTDTIGTNTSDDIEDGGE